MPVLIVVAAIALAILFAYIAHRARQRRIEAWRRAAAQLGFQYSHEDPIGVDDHPFELFGRGDGRGCENVAWGPHHGTKTVAFEYWYYEESYNSATRTTSRTYHRFTCAIAELGATFPNTSLGPESFLSRIADHIGFRDIEFESEEFNRRWQVRSTDKRFASYLVDPRMIEWLMANEGWDFELSGRYVLLASGRLDPQEVPGFLEVLREFREHIPRVVMDVYAG